MKALSFVSSLILCLFITLPACSSTPIGDYPEHWWKHVDPATAPEWEILPQEASKGEVILSKRNELGILSNFAHTPFELDGKSYESVEGLWQMMKYPEGKDDPRRNPKVTWELTRKEVSQMWAFEAKRAGKAAGKNMKTLGIKWLTYKGQRLFYKGAHTQEHYEIIKAAMWKKVLQNNEVKKILTSTGNLILRADHKQKAGSPPAYNYPGIWMDIRTELQQ